MLRLRVQLGGDTVGQGLATFHFVGDDTTSGATAAATAVSAFMTALNPIRPAYGTWAILPDVQEISVGDNKVSDSFAVTATAGTGTNGATQLPFTTQGLIRLRTGVFVNGRELKGRLFIPGPSQTSNANGAPTSTYVSTLNSAATNLMGATGPDWAVYSRPFEGSVRDPNPRLGQAASLSSATCWSKWAVLRSRRD
jgi:hypothetical protein